MSSGFISGRHVRLWKLSESDAHYLGFNYCIDFDLSGPKTIDIMSPIFLDTKPMNHQALNDPDAPPTILAFNNEENVALFTLMVSKTPE